LDRDQLTPAKGRSRNIQQLVHSQVRSRVAHWYTLLTILK
jgi:hypothetical protein